MLPNEGFDFGSLNLNNVIAATAATVLAPGRYVCTTSDAKIESTKDKAGKFISVRLRDVKGRGIITARLNIHNKSAQAVQIGLEQLKGLLVAGGHPDPDNIGSCGVDSINGLTVGVVVKPDSYNGEERSQVGAFCKASDVKGYEDSVPAAGGTIGGDDLPF